MANVVSTAASLSAARRTWESAAPSTTIDVACSRSTAAPPPSTTEPPGSPSWLTAVIPAWIRWRAPSTRATAQALGPGFCPVSPISSPGTPISATPYPARASVTSHATVVLAPWLLRRRLMVFLTRPGDGQGPAGVGGPPGVQPGGPSIRPGLALQPKSTRRQRPDHQTAGHRRTCRSSTRQPWMMRHPQLRTALVGLVVERAVRAVITTGWPVHRVEQVVRPATRGHLLLGLLRI